MWQQWRCQAGDATARPSLQAARLSAPHVGPGRGRLVLRAHLRLSGRVGKSRGARACAVVSFSRASGVATLTSPHRRRRRRRYTTAPRVTFVTLIHSGTPRAAPTTSGRSRATRRHARRRGAHSSRSSVTRRSYRTGAASPASRAASRSDATRRRRHAPLPPRRLRRILHSSSPLSLCPARHLPSNAPP